MTFAQLVRKIERSGVGYKIEAVVKKSRMMDAPSIFYLGELYLPEKTLHAESPTPAGIWDRYRDELAPLPPQLALDQVDLERLPKRLARRERA